MENRQKLAQDLDLVSSLAALAEAYEEISVSRMQKIRSKVVMTREFIESLSKVFYIVKISNKKEVARLLAKHKKSHNSKNIPIGSQDLQTSATEKSNTVSVFVSANSRFYGDVIKKVFHMFTFTLFVENIKKTDSDIVIIGKLGRDLFEQQLSNKKYRYFEIPDSSVGIDDVVEIIKLLIQYDKVNVFYGKFVNVVTQIPAVSSISGDDPLGDTHAKIEKKLEFKFEPTLFDVLSFFETQGFASIFMQAVHESELSRFASRITAMEQAIANIRREEELLKTQNQRLSRMKENKKQLQSLAGAWSLVNLSGIQRK